MPPCRHQVAVGHAHFQFVDVGATDRINAAGNFKAAPFLAGIDIVKRRKYDFNIASQHPRPRGGFLDAPCVSLLPRHYSLLNKKIHGSPGKKDSTAAGVTLARPCRIH